MFQAREMDGSKIRKAPFLCSFRQFSSLCIPTLLRGKFIFVVIFCGSWSFSLVRVELGLCSARVIWVAFAVQLF